MPINESTKTNLRRKSAYIDNVQMHGDVPLFSWIDFNVTELCNRQCVFCPRIDPSFYPNQNLHIAPELIQKIADELHALNYQGAIVLCGYGEPLLHPKLDDLVARFGESVRVEIVTNGDFLTPETISKLIAAGTDYFVVSMYDGPHQTAAFRSMFKEAGCDEEQYLLRDRWHSEEDGFGLKLTNRAGTVSVGVQEEIDVTHPCHYLAYSMTVDWNGDVLLCVQDWHKKVKLGNLNHQSLLEIWTSSPMCKRRIQLAHGRRTSAPCNTCNADGTLHGFNHVRAWGVDSTAN